MPGPYPVTSYDNFVHPTDGVTNFNSAWFSPRDDAINNLEQFLGLSSDAPSAVGTVSAKVAYLLAGSAHITFGLSTAFPGSPVLHDIFITTDTTPWTPYIFQGGGVWKVLGGDAVSLLGIPILPGTPSNNQVLRYNSTDAKWELGSATGFADPLSAPWALYTHDTANAPHQILIGTLGQVPTVQIDGSLAYATPPYMAAPAGAVEGSIPIYISGAWTHADPSTTGYVWTSNGAGAAPTFQAIPVTPPGSGLPAPGGARIGSLLHYDETGTWSVLLPGAAGTILTAHGDNNVVGSKLTWASISGMTNPMTSPGDTIVGGSSGTPGRLGIGSPGQFYRVSSGAPAWQGLDGGKTGTYLEYAEQAGNPTAIANSGLVFTKTDHHLYFMESGGTLHDLLAAGTGYNSILDEGGALTARTAINFVGAGVTAADDAANTRTKVTIDVMHASGTGHTAGVAPDPGASAGTTKFLREDATWAVPAGGGGGGSGGSRFSITTDGLIADFDFSQKADATLSNTADADGWQVATTIDAGTWIFRNGRLVNTSRGNYDRLRNMNVSQLAAVYEAHLATPSQAGHYVGHRFAIQAGADTDYHTLERTADRQLNSRAAGTNSSIATGTNFTAINNEVFAVKAKFTFPGSVRTLDHRLNGVQMFGGTSSSGPTTAGGIGLLCYPNGSGLDSEFFRYSVYSDTTVAVTGMSGTQAFRVYSAGGTLLASSGTQSGGTASVDLIDRVMPVLGHITMFTSNTYATPETGASRWPAEGEGIIWGGRVFAWA